MANKQSNLKFIQTIKNIWKVEDLRVRIGITLLFVAIYRFGSQIVLPGIDTVALLESAKLADQTKGGLMSLLDMFSGGAFSNASIFALGIMPYISASIVLQLMALAVPYFQKLQREGEIYGMIPRAKIDAFENAPPENISSRDIKPPFV